MDVGDGQHPLGDPGPDLDLPAVDVEHREPAEGLAHPGVVADQLTQLAGPVVGGGELGVGVVAGGERRAHGQLHLDLDLAGLQFIGELAGQADAVAEEGDGLAVTGPLGGDPRRPLEVDGRFLHQACRLVVPGHLLGGDGRSGRRAAVELACHPLVDGAPVPAEQ